MCRFLLVKSKIPVEPQSFLKQFASMAEKSKADDGDRQEDGWGFSWLDRKNSWKVYRSLKPIWKNKFVFDSFPRARLFAIHARSASFPRHKRNIAFNQPYLNNPYIFVFNGLLKGVSLSIPGKIGAEKIWFLLQKALDTNKPIEALKKVKNLLKANAKEIKALNIGLSDGTNIYALTYYTQYPEYYHLRYIKNNRLSVISSEPIGTYNFSSAYSESILSF